MLDLIWRDFAVEVADSILIGSLVQLGVGRLIGLSHFAFGEDFLLAVASADVDRVEFCHCIDLALKYLLVATRVEVNGIDGRRRVLYTARWSQMVLLYTN